MAVAVTECEVMNSFYGSGCSEWRDFLFWRLRQTRHILELPRIPTLFNFNRRNSSLSRFPAKKKISYAGCFCWKTSRCPFGGSMWSRCPFGGSKSAPPSSHKHNFFRTHCHRRRRIHSPPLPLSCQLLPLLCIVTCQKYP